MDNRNLLKNFSIISMAKKSTIRTVVFLLFLSVFTTSVFSQATETDSLLVKLRDYDIAKKASGQTALTLRDTVKVRILDGLSVAYSEKEPEKSFSYAMLQFKLSKAIAHPMGMADALSSIGIYYEYKGNYKLAHLNYQKALAIAKRNDFKDFTVFMLCNIGICYFKQGIYPEALKFLQEALRESEASHSVDNILACTNNIGNVYFSLHKHELALQYYLKALQLQLRQKEPYNISITYLNIGESYREVGKDDLALEYLAKSLENAKKDGDYNTMAANYSGLGRVYSNKKDYPKALENHLKAKAIREDTQNTSGMCMSYISLGDVYLKMGKNAEALRYVQMAQDLIKGRSEVELSAEINHQLSAIYSALGNYKMAFESQKLYKIYNDSTFNAENHKQLVEQQLNFDFRNIQEKKDLVARQEAKRQKDTRNFIVIIAALVVIFLVILILQRNKIARIRRQKALQDERNRINRDLHDSLGAQLSTVRMYVSGLQGEPKATDTVNDTLGLLDDSIHELRRIMNDEESSQFKEIGLIEAVAALATKTHLLHTITFSLNHNFDTRLPHHIEHELYRILQELVNNTLKYADAKQITIDLTQRDGNIILFYEDDGKGFDPVSALRGNGISNIEFRAQQLKGNVEIDSEPGHGARTIVEIPLGI